MSATTSARPARPAEHAHDPGPAQQLGVILLIVADAAFVLSLVFTYFYLRGLNTSGNWIPKGSRTLGIADGWVIAGVMVVSLLAYRWGELGIRAGERGRLVVGTALALAALLADLGLQVRQLGSLPFHMTTGSYASTVMTLAGYHLVHLALTLLLGIGIWNRARLNLFSAQSHWHVRVVGYWWMWVTASAVLSAVCTSFVASPHVVH